MKLKTISQIFLLIILFTIFFIVYSKFDRKDKSGLNIGVVNNKTICEEYKKGKITTGSVSLIVDMADDYCKKTLGLSGRTSLDGEGMLFVFEESGNYGFWMKDMNFPIDILWIDDTFTIMGIEKEVSPDTYPKSFGEKFLAKYVLEVPSQYSDKNKINVGDKIIFSEL